MKINLIQKLLSLLIILFSSPVMAQQTVPDSQSFQFDYTTVVMVFVLIITILVLVVALYLLYVVKLLVKKTQIVATQSIITQELQKKTHPIPQKKVWAQISARMTKAVPIEQEDSILLDHDYDGIKELDNHLPPWWTGLFYFTIVVGVVYLLVYHVIMPEWAPLQDEAYALETKRFEEQRSQMANFIDEENVELTLLTEDLENGRQIYLNNCAACHRQDGGGSIGPNLTDEYWIHGNSVQDVFKVVKYGVTGKMVAWESMLSGKDMRNVTSWVLNNLIGSNPENPKEPEGELLQPNLQSSSDNLDVNGNVVALIK